MTGREVLALYREALRVARSFPDRSMGRKLKYNASELIRLRQHERSAVRIQTHLTEGRDALNVYRVLQRDTELLAAITRKKRPVSESESDEKENGMHTL